MNTRAQIEKKISAKQQEVSEFEVKIHAANSYIQAMQEVLRMLPKEEVETGSGGEQLLRHGSAMAQTREFLLKHGKPMHITEILKGIGKENDKAQRLSVSGSLRNYAREGRIFTLVGGNIFGLVGWNTSADSNAVREVPPPGFGLSSEDEAA